MEEKINKVQDQIDNQLLKERKVFLWGMVDDESAKHVIDRLLYLDSLKLRQQKKISTKNN